MSEELHVKKKQLSRNLCIFARERRAKLLTLGKMSKLFCPRLTAALQPETIKQRQLWQQRQQKPPQLASYW